VSVIDPPVSITAAMAAVVEPSCVVKRPLYGEVLEFPVSSAKPSVIQLIVVDAPSLTNRNGDPTNTIHDSFEARATVVLQTPLVGVGGSNEESEKSSPPPARTIKGLMLPAGKSLMVPVPEVNVPPEYVMSVGRPVAMHPKFVPALGSQVIVVAVIVIPPSGVQLVILTVPIGLAAAWLESPRRAIPANK
jgi:hypothetical protein